jgi:hypothetical protein
VHLVISMSGFGHSRLDRTASSGPEFALNGHAGAVTRCSLSRDQRTYSANNLVSVPRKELAFRDRATVFSIAGSVEIWDCRENRLPNSKVDVVLKDVGFGVKPPDLINSSIGRATRLRSRVDSALDLHTGILAQLHG